MLVDGFCDRMVEMVDEKRDDTVPDGQAEVKVQTLGRGKGQGPYGKPSLTD